MNQNGEWYISRSSILPKNVDKDIILSFFRKRFTACLHYSTPIMSDNAQPPLKAADAKNPTFGVDSVSVEVGTSYSADEESIVVRKIDMR